MANEAKKDAVAIQPIDVMRNTITALVPEFKAALPPQIPVERFIRTIITTIQMNPDLLQADRKSVLATCMKAAQDGLLLDGREAAPVVFKGKCQYIPMVAGILKKMRNSGEIASVDVQTVYENDHFEYVLGDDAHITHKPVITGERGPSIAWYAIVKTKDGGIYREVQNKDDIEKVRKVSKAKSEDAPWFQWYEEMAEKTVLKKISKRAPSSADLEQVIDHDNEMIGFVQKVPSVEVRPEKEISTQPSYLKMLTETDEGGTVQQESVGPTENIAPTASQGAPPVDDKAAIGVPPPPTDPSSSVEQNAVMAPMVSPMEKKAMDAMTVAMGNRRLDKAWTDNVPGNLKTTDPEAYKRLEAHYTQRLHSFRAK